MPTDYTGGNSNHANAAAGYAYAFPITITGSGTVQTIGVNWYGSQSGQCRVALYSNQANKPKNLLTESAAVSMVYPGWQDIPVPGCSVSPGSYWVAIQIQVTQGVYYIAATR